MATKKSSQLKTKRQRTAFAASIEKFKAQTLVKIQAIYAKTVNDVVADAQRPVSEGGRMPVVTGFLRGSIVVGPPGGEVGGEGYVLSFADAALDSVLNIGWTAYYARYVEFGAQGRPGRFFMRGAADKWPYLIKINAAKMGFNK